VRLYGRVNGALIQWLTIFVSKRKEVGFQIKNLVVDLVAAIVHQANIASLKRAAISRQDWEVVIRTVPDVRRMPLLGEGRGTFRAVTVFPHRATIDISLFHRHIIAYCPLIGHSAFRSTAARRLRYRCAPYPRRRFRRFPLTPPLMPRVPRRRNRSPITISVFFPGVLDT